MSSTNIVYHLIISGIGLVFSATPIDVAIPLVFGESRALAVGISFLGLRTGYAIGPMAAERLLYHFGLRGTLLLMAGIVLHRVPLSLLIWCPQDVQKTAQHPIAPCSLKGILNFRLFRNWSVYTPVLLNKSVAFSMFSF